jgi:hypothetical protein
MRVYPSHVLVNMNMELSLRKKKSDVVMLISRLLMMMIVDTTVMRPR